MKSKRYPFYSGVLTGLIVLSFLVGNIEAAALFAIALSILFNRED